MITGSLKKWEFFHLMDFPCFFFWWKNTFLNSFTFFMKSMIWRKYNVKLYTNKGLNLSGANIALVNESVVWTPRWHAPLPLAPPVLLWLVMLQGSCTGQLSVWHHTMGNVFQGLTPQDLSSPILEMKEIRITPAHDTHHKIISSHLTTALLITL